MTEETQKPKAKAKAILRARRDFHIFCPTRKKVYDIQIKEGDDLSDIPEIFIPNLKTEGVI